MILTERAARLEAEAVAVSAKAEAAGAQADRFSHEALNAHLKLEIEKLRRELCGTSSERKARLLLQMEYSWKTWRQLRPRTNWRLNRRRPVQRRYTRPSVNGLCENPSPIICRVSAW